METQPDVAPLRKETTVFGDLFLRPGVTGSNGAITVVQSEEWGEENPKGCGKIEDSIRRELHSQSKRNDDKKTRNESWRERTFIGVK